MTDDTTDVLVRQTRMAAATLRPSTDRPKLTLRLGRTGIPITAKKDRT